MIDLLTQFWVWPLLGGVAVAMASGPLGAILVWKRVTYLGDTLAHALLLGVSLHFLWQVPLEIGLIGMALILASLLGVAYQKSHLSQDGFLVLLSQGALATSIVLMAIAGFSGVELITYLVGDILILQPTDVGLVLLMDGIICGTLWIFWPQCLSLIAHEELAAIEGVPTKTLRFMLFAMLGVFMAVTLKMVGALLLSTFLIAPPLTAKPFVKTPEQMVLGAIGVGIIGTILGLWLSFAFNLPTGPLICLCFLGMWGGALMINTLKKTLFF